MSLRDSYFNGATGIQQQMDAAFQAGITYVGAGGADLSTLDLGDRNGSNLGAGSSNPGLYFKVSTPGATYALWMYVSGEVAPSVAGAQVIQVTILSGDSGSQVAVKIANVLNSIGPFSATAVASAISILNDALGVVIAPLSTGTLGGTSVAANVVPGIAATGNFLQLQNALESAAAQGQQYFSVNVLSTGSVNASYLRGNNGNNQLLKSFFAGIMQALANQDIYNYQVRLQLDVSDQVNTNVIFWFNFGGMLKNGDCGCNSSLTTTTIMATAMPIPRCF